MAAQIEILSETDIPAGWEFQCQVVDGDGMLHQHALQLSWADYNYWSSDGSDCPAEVAAAVLRFVYDRLDATAIQRAFDAAVLRRQFQDADEQIPRYIS